MATKGLHFVIRITFAERLHDRHWLLARDARIAKMDKFIVSLPRGNSQSKVRGVKRPLHSPASASAGEGKGKAPRTFGSASRAAPQVQSFLDLGQQSFGAYTTCSACDMLYVIGDVDDEARHKAFCARAGQALALSSIKSFHVVDHVDFDNDADCIVEVRGSERHKLEQEPLRSILHMVQRELGSTLTLMEDKSESILLYTRDKKVIGCVVREAVEASQLIALTLEKGTADVDVSTVSSQTDDAEAKSTAQKLINPVLSKADNISRPTGATMGIKLIWIFEKNRREGLASRLLDTARNTFEFGRIIKKEHVAYSQPTDQGLRLFLAYSKQAEIWGYC